MQFALPCFKMRNKKRGETIKDSYSLLHCHKNSTESKQRKHNIPHRQQLSFFHETRKYHTIQYSPPSAKAT